MESMVQKQEDIVQLEQTVERCLDKRLAELRAPAPSRGLETLETELKHQRELMQQGFEHMEKRFEAMDKRFEELRSDMNQRFEATDRRFEAVDKRFEELRSDMNQRFEAVDRRFEAMDKRFEELRSDMNQRFVFMQWMIMAGFGLMGLMMSLYKFFP